MSARALLVAMLLMADIELPAHAHGWYPKECCSKDDCMPADAIAANEQGEKVVIVGRHRIPISRRLDTRPSPDNQVHICFVILEAEYSAPYALPLCLFVPAQS